MTQFVNRDYTARPNHPFKAHQSVAIFFKMVAKKAHRVVWVKDARNKAFHLRTRYD